MKIYRILHHRCDHYPEDITYIVVHDNTTDEEVRKCVDEAQGICLDNARMYKEFEGTAPKFIYSKEAYLSNCPPSTTIGDALKKYNEVLSKFEERKRIAKLANKKFSDILVEVGRGKLIPITYYETPEDQEIDLHWGHNHGLDINYHSENLKDFSLRDSDV